MRCQLSLGMGGWGWGMRGQPWGRVVAPHWAYSRADEMLNPVVMSVCTGFWQLTPRAFQLPPTPNNNRHNARSRLSSHGPVRYPDR